MLKLLCIALGGAAGSVLRYLLGGSVQRYAGADFPYGTLTVNVLGCLVIGLLSGWFASPQLIREEYRLGLTIGLLGGFTTFSTFGLETFSLANERQMLAAAMNIALSCGLGIAAVWLGYRLAERWFGV